MQGSVRPQSVPTSIPPAAERPPAIEFVGIDKRFGANHANRNIHLTIRAGSIHGLVGENGAGKSTLMSILYGFYQADRGEIRVNGRRTAIRSSAQAIAAGIGMVHQQFMLVDTMTVLENVLLGAEGSATLGPAEKRARAVLARLASDYELEVDPDATVADLSVGEQQRVEILKTLYRGAEILILDEPTAVLTPAEVEHLFRILRRLQGEGKTVVVITHKLKEIMAVTDEVSVMRKGEIVATWPTADTSVESLAQAMVGRRVLLEVEKGPSVPGAVELAVEHLTLRDKRGVIQVDDVSLEVRAGEIVGIAGVAGNGQSELLEAIAGIRHAASGAIRLGEIEITRLDPSEIRDLGLAHIPEDRHRMGLVLSFSAEENLMLGYQDDPRWAKGLLLDTSALRTTAEAEFVEFDVRPPEPAQRTALFSGGNQQKIILAREIDREPKVLIVGQPTRGVDIGAIEAIHRRLIEMRDAGRAILLVSAELDEIRSLSDRILCMCQGRITGECRPETSEAEIGMMMAGLSGTAAKGATA
ncbi:ABC transporter ATP-binding protein [Pinisolibacter sp.]|uniref:ABC transporter ATP-binding protein n=1 Tax=Pinisolibacter sp. TaxID=2172024 RepID=UPI002FDF0351